MPVLRPREIVAIDQLNCIQDAVAALRIVRQNLSTADRLVAEGENAAAQHFANLAITNLQTIIRQVNEKRL